MKVTLLRCSSTLFIVLALLCVGYSQTDQGGGLDYQISKLSPPISMTKSMAVKARKLIDLYPDFKSSWVREYSSVVVSSTIDGTVVIAEGSDIVLTADQIELIAGSDTGAAISVIVKYIPENNLKHNDLKEMSFMVRIAPETDACFIGGKDSLRSYINDVAISKIADNSFQGFDMAAVTFCVDEEGIISDVVLFNSSTNETVDQLLIGAVTTMPQWIPARYADGTHVRQDYVLTAGNMENCMINLLNIE